MKLFLKTKDFSVSGEPFELHWDEELDMLVTRPQPENLARYYESEIKFYRFICIEALKIYFHITYLFIKSHFKL